MATQQLLQISKVPGPIAMLTWLFTWAGIGVAIAVPGTGRGVALLLIPALALSLLAGVSSATST